MRLLLDANLSPQRIPGLSAAGHEVRHVMDLGLMASPDEEIFLRAAKDDCVVITADPDFSMLLAARGSAHGQGSSDQSCPYVRY